MIRGVFRLRTASAAGPTLRYAMARPRVCPWRRCFRNATPPPAI